MRYVHVVTQAKFTLWNIRNYLLSFNRCLCPWLYICDIDDCHKSRMGKHPGSHTRVMDYDETCFTYLTLQSCPQLCKRSECIGFLSYVQNDLAVGNPGNSGLSKSSKQYIY